MSRPRRAGLLLGPLAAIAGAGLIYLLVALSDEPATPEVPVREASAVQEPVPLVRAPTAPPVRSRPPAPVPPPTPGAPASSAPTGPAHAGVHPPPVGAGPLQLEELPEPVLEPDRRRGTPVTPPYLRRTNQRPGGQPADR